MRYRRKQQYVEYKGLFGGFRKMPREAAGKLILADYDKSPIKSDMLLEAMNARLKGVTIQEYLRERRDKELVAEHMSRIVQREYARA